MGDKYIFKIGIVGCGWLGLPLGKELAQQGHDVGGSTTTWKKVELLKLAGIRPFFLDISDESSLVRHDELFNSDLIIITIPPGVDAPGDYFEKIENLIPFINSKALFTSSIGVFGNHQGSVTESTRPEPDTQLGKELLSVEELLRSRLGDELTIVRLGGLVGWGRNPARSLAGKTGIKNGTAPINLIHGEDALGVIMSIIELGKWGEIYHAVCDDHEKKSSFYNSITSELGLSSISFLDGDGKVVLNNKIKQDLGYQQKYPSIKNTLIQS